MTIRKKTADELINEWKEGDRFIGTGFACGHYSRCAKESVEKGEATAEVALQAYDLCTRGMDRWNKYHRPLFGKELADKERREKVVPAISKAIRSSPEKSLTRFLLEVAIEYQFQDRYRRSYEALRFAELRSRGDQAKEIKMIRDLLEEDL